MSTWLACPIKKKALKKYQDNRDREYDTETSWESTLVRHYGRRKRGLLLFYQNAGIAAPPHPPEDLESHRKSPPAHSPNCSDILAAPTPPLPLWIQPTKNVISNGIERVAFSPNIPYETTNTKGATGETVWEQDGGKRKKNPPFSVFPCRERERERG